MTVVPATRMYERLSSNLYLLFDSFISLTREDAKARRKVSSRMSLLSTLSLLIDMPLLAQNGWSRCVSYVPIMWVPLLWAAARIMARVRVGIYSATSSMMIRSIDLECPCRPRRLPHVGIIIQVESGLMVGGLYTPHRGRVCEISSFVVCWSGSRPIPF